jgi:membrane associated rhomboid family serine protease
MPSSRYDASRKSPSLRESANPDILAAAGPQGDHCRCLGVSSALEASCEEPAAIGLERRSLRHERGVSETTFTLNKVPLLPRPGLQISIVLIELIMGIFVGFLLGATVGYGLPCAAAGACLGLVLGITSARKLGGASIPLSVIVDATHLRLLRRKRRKNILAVPLEEVRSIEERGKGGSRMLIISTLRRSFLFPWVAFDAGMPERIRDAVRAALTLRPTGPELVAAMERREQLGRELMLRRPRVIWALVICICFAFAVELAAGALKNPAVLLSLGGNAPVLVADGQWWRLLAANFLHASWLHINLNYFALVLLGSMLERLVGAPRMLAIALVSGAAGNIVSALAARAVFSVGVSSIVFGMIGALFVVNLRSRDALPGGFRLSWARWAILLGLNVLITLLPVVDGLAHLGGLVGGAAAAFVLVPKDLEGQRTRIAAGMVGACLTIAYVLAFGAAMLNSAKSGARADFLRAAFDNPRLPATSLNDLAWRLAINPATHPDELAAAVRATRRVVDENPHNSTYRDTHAYVLHREGRLEQAFEQERIALIGAEAHATSAKLYTMFLRFLVERGPANSDAATVRLDGGDVVVESAIPSAVIFAGRPEQGLVRIILPEGVREARVAAPQGLSDGTLPVWLIDGAGPEPRASTTQISFAPRDVGTATLP